MTARANRRQMSRLMRAVALSGLIVAPAAAQQSPPSPAAEVEGVRALLGQAEFWHQRGRTDLAAQAMQRVYALAPNDPDVIFALGRFALAEGKPQTAQAWYRQLRSILQPGDTRLAQLEQGLRQGLVPGNGIEMARRLAQTGRTAEAVAQYRRLFDNQAPPPAYALEYYQTLAGTPEGLGEALNGLARLAQANPLGPEAVAYGKALTYSEQSRREGIALLATRADDDDARTAWRQALLWLGAGSGDRALYDTYLARFPEDREVQAHFEQGARPAGRTDGFAALEAGDSRLAEQRFKAKLAEAPSDPDALGGLGILRLRAGDYGAARDYLDRAIKADPSRRGQWSDALSSAQYLGTMASARKSRDAGRLREAESRVRGLAGQPGTRGRDARLLLADIMARQGNLSDAEREYRLVLRTDSGNATALSGLYELLVRQHRTSEAQAIAAQLPPGRARNAESLDRAQASALRNRAKDSLAAGDLISARADLETAFASDRNNPWLRLDLARVMTRQGDIDRAAGLIDDMAAGPNPSPDTLHAAALFASEQGRPAVAAALIERIPARARTAEMRALVSRSETEGVLAQARTALARGDTVGAQARLRPLYDRAAEFSLADRAAIAQALIDAGDPALGLSLVRRDLEAQPKPPAANYAGHLRILGSLGMDAEMERFLARLASARGVDDTETRSLGTEAAAARAERQRLAGDYADAYDTLAAALAGAPADIGLLNALGRLYASGEMPAQALAAYRRVLAIDPSNKEATRGAITVALGNGDTATADRMLKAALGRAPGDVDLHLIAADLARAKGDNQAALEALETAQSLRTRQLGATAAVPSPGSQIPRGATPGNPFRRSAVGVTAPAVADAALPDRHAETQSPRQTATAIAGDSEGGLYLPDGRPLEIVPRTYGTTAAPLPPAATAPYIPPPPTLAAPPRPPADTATVAPARPRPVPPRPVLLPAPTLADTSVLMPGLPSSALAADPVSQDIARQMAELKEQAATFVRGDVNFRNRSGDDGLSALTEVGAELGLSVSPFSTGRLTLTASPTDVDSGTPSGDGARRFGMNPLIPTTVTSANHQALAAIVTDNGQVWSLLTPQERTILGAATTTPVPTLLSEFVTANPALIAGLSTPLRDDIQAAATGTLLSDFVTANPGIWTTLTADQRSTLGAAIAAGVYSFDTNRMAAIRRTPPQEVSGVGLSAAYEIGNFKADAGSTPLGFEVTNFVGGVTWRPKLGANTELALTGERRAIKDSMLSYAGTVEPFTGKSWGGVTRTGGRVMLSTDDQNVGLYGGGGYYKLEGENVADNTSIEATVGAYFRPYRSETGELKAGVNLTYMGYDENLGEFSFGHGGYFSPQTFYSFAVPVEYSGTSSNGKWKYAVGGAVGYQSYDKDAAPYFPTDPALQGIMDREAANGLISSSLYPASSASGFGASFNGSVDYALDRLTTVGASASHNGFGDYSETSGMIYLKHVLELEP